MFALHCGDGVGHRGPGIAGKTVQRVDAGDALRLSFDATAFPPPAPGRERTWLFYSVGWDKDADHNVIAGDTVGPLFAGVDGDSEWQRRWNTRWVPADKHRPRG